MSLESLRKKIDKLDASIVALLDERAKLAIAIGREKKKLGAPVFEPQRELSIIRRLSSLSKSLGAENVERIYSEIISASRTIQEGSRELAAAPAAPRRAAARPPKDSPLSFLGPPGTFSHLALISHFGQDAKLAPQETIDDVFKSVEGGGSAFGVVPVENSTEGSVNSTLDLLLSSPLQVCGEIKLKIEQNLLAKKGVSLSDIQTIYAHPQAFAQCKRFLSSLKAERREVASTAKACPSLDARSATIGSSLAAEIYGLAILRRNIQDSSDNTTRFLVLGNAAASQTGRDKTSIIFAVPDEPGSLVRMLEIFSSAGINLSKIESRPSRQKPWEYLFYVDLEGHREEGKRSAALAEVRKRAKFLKVLGSYPAAQ